jgi:hypothetical protein
MQFLQLGEVQAHRSVINVARNVGNNKQEWIHATTSSKPMLDDGEQAIVPELMTESDNEMKVWGYLMTQYNLKPGLRKFGEREATAMVDKLTQLHIMDMWTGMDPSKLSHKDRMKAQSLLMFLKEKQGGKIKGRACINGAPQRVHIPKEEAALPTVSTESTFITATIAASKTQKVRCYDVPSAFANTDVDEDVLMVLKGELAEMMTKIAPQVYRNYVMADRKGMPILYMKLQKALYGLMRASLC